MHTFKSLQLNPENVVVLYHAGCLDGITAAAVATHFDNCIAVLPVQYNSEPNFILLHNKDVLMFDICYPKTVLQSLQTQVKSIYVFDHHKTAMEDAGELDFTFFDMNRSGAMLAWDFFFPDKNAPLFVKYIQDNDLYTFTLPETRNVIAFVSMYPLNARIFEKFIMYEEKDFAKEIYNTGRTTLSFKDSMVQRICSSSKVGIYTFDDLEFASINSCMFANEIAEYMYTNYRLLDFVIVWRFDPVSNMYLCSLRSASDRVDVSVIASLFGGGGHVHAAGMSIEVPPHELSGVSQL